MAGIWIVRWRFSLANTRGNEMLYGPFKHRSDALMWAHNHIDDPDRYQIEFVNDHKE